MAPLLTTTSLDSLPTWLIKLMDQFTACISDRVPQGCDEYLELDSFVQAPGVSHPWQVAFNFALKTTPAGIQRNRFEEAQKVETKAKSGEMDLLVKLVLTRGEAGALAVFQSLQANQMIDDDYIAFAHALIATQHPWSTAIYSGRDLPPEYRERFFIETLLSSGQNEEKTQERFARAQQNNPLETGHPFPFLHARQAVEYLDLLVLYGFILLADPTMPGDK